MELLFRHLPEAVEMHVACPDEPPYKERFRQLLQGRMYSIPHRRIDTGAVLGLANYIRNQQIDLIHTHGKGAGVYGRLTSMLTGITCLHTPHGIHIPPHRSVYEQLYKLYENFSSHWVDRIIFVSTDEREVARTQGFWPNVQSVVITNGVENIADNRRQSFRQMTREALGIQDDALVVMTLSRFDFQKNMEEAYVIAQSLPELNFIWVGDGDDAAQLKQRAQKEALSNLYFLGSVDNPESVLAAADVYLSTARWEGLPFAVLEAMAMKLPVVATDVPGHRGLIEEARNGILYQPGAINKAVNALKRLAANAELRQQLGLQGQAIQRKHYSANRMAHHIHSIYLELKNQVYH